MNVPTLEFKALQKQLTAKDLQIEELNAQVDQLIDKLAQVLNHVYEDAVHRESKQARHLRLVDNAGGKR